MPRWLTNRGLGDHTRAVGAAVHVGWALSAVMTTLRPMAVTSKAAPIWAPPLVGATGDRGDPDCPGWRRAGGTTPQLQIHTRGDALTAPSTVATSAASASAWGTRWDWSSALPA